MFKKVAVLLLIMALVLTACAQQAPQEQAAEPPAETGGAAPAQEGRPWRFVVVTHGQASDPFWSVVKNGVDAGAADMGVKVEYQAPQTFDMAAMSQLIDAAVASNPDGLVVSPISGRHLLYFIPKLFRQLFILPK